MESRDGRVHFLPEVIDKVARTVDSMDRHSTVFDTAAIGITAYTLVEMAQQSMGEDVTVGDVFTNSNLSDVLGGIDYQSLGQDLAIDAAIAVAQRAVGGPLSLALSGYQLWQSYDGLSASLELYANHQGRYSIGDYFGGLFERDPEGHVFDDNTVETDPLVDDSLGFIGGAENHVSPLDIDGDDADFTKLVVWGDLNQDGTIQPGEPVTTIMYH